MVVRLDKEREILIRTVMVIVTMMLIVTVTLLVTVLVPRLAKEREIACRRTVAILLGLAEEKLGCDLFPTKVYAASHFQKEKKFVFLNDLRTARTSGPEGSLRILLRPRMFLLLRCIVQFRPISVSFIVRTSGKECHGQGGSTSAIQLFMF